MAAAVHPAGAQSTDAKVQKYMVTAAGARLGGYAAQSNNLREFLSDKSVFLRQTDYRSAAKVYFDPNGNYYMSLDDDEKLVQGHWEICPYSKSTEGIRMDLFFDIGCSRVYFQKEQNGDTSIGFVQRFSSNPSNKDAVYMVAHGIIFPGRNGWIDNLIEAEKESKSLAAAGIRPEDVTELSNIYWHYHMGSICAKYGVVFDAQSLEALGKAAKKVELRVGSPEVVKQKWDEMAAKMTNLAPLIGLDTYENFHKTCQTEMMLVSSYVSDNLRQPDKPF
ncbi:hypothetical protein [Mesorhizobium silamurunense]|uniref:hypothetical protein n=1 Tax=Mesorhizobium silamurunense TaxID=499528 RepID=UPI00178470D0|nr:hypothetical protein [Mesorhizobium silamurunense]